MMRATATMDGPFDRSLSHISGWRPAAMLCVALALAGSVTPWNVLHSTGLSMPGHTLVAAQLILGLVLLVLVARAETRAPSLATLAVLALVVGGTAFTAMADMAQARAFSLAWADVRALNTARALVGGAAVLALFTCASGAIRHTGERRKLELGLGGMSAMIGAAALLWEPLADLTHPMVPGL